MAKGVLLVQTDPLRARELDTTLATAGYVSRQVGTAEHALALLKAWVPDVIVIDLVLPRMSGLLFTEKVKADPATRDVVVIATTCLLSEEVERVAREVGCADCVHEAIGADRIVERVTAQTRGIK